MGFITYEVVGLTVDLVTVVVGREVGNLDRGTVLGMFESSTFTSFDGTPVGF